MVEADSLSGGGCDFVIHVLGGGVLEYLGLEELGEPGVALNLLGPLQVLHDSEHRPHDVLRFFRALRVADELDVLLELFLERLQQQVHVADHDRRRPGDEPAYYVQADYHAFLRGVVKPLDRHLCDVIAVAALRDFLEHCVQQVICRLPNRDAFVYFVLEGAEVDFGDEIRPDCRLVDGHLMELADVVADAVGLAVYDGVQSLERVALYDEV